MSRFVASQAAVFGVARDSASRDSSLAAVPSESAVRSTPAPRVMVRCRSGRIAASATQAGVMFTRTGSAWGGRSRPMSSAIRLAKTRPSSSELLASRFAPCTPVQATSPQA